MNIIFLNKSVFIWIELSLIFFHVSNPNEELEAQENTCLFGASRCEFLCKVRGYRYAVCNHEGCSCFNYYLNIGKSAGCQSECDTSCRYMKIPELGLCDHKNYCYCYIEHEKLNLKNDSCTVPNQYCKWKCIKKMNFTHGICSSDLCICHNNRQNVQLFDYKTGHCVLPRNYCHSRCYNASFDDGGFCSHSDCVCTEGKDLYFLIELEDKETICETCRIFCEDDFAAKGICVAGDCICVNGNWFTVAIFERQQSYAGGLTKDSCMKICAENGYHMKALATGYAECLCGQDDNNIFLNIGQEKDNAKRLFKGKKLSDLL